MSNAPEEKAFLVEGIAKLLGTRPLYYLKFCSCENFAEDVCNGNLYANTVEYFRQKEIATGERGQGDQFELLLSIQFENINIIDIRTGDVVITAPKATLEAQLDDNLTPIVSFVGIPLGELDIIEVNETHAEFKFPFTDEEYIIMSERFGEYCVILEAREIEAKVASYCNDFGCDYVFDRVEYCDQNRIDRMQAFSESSKERFLYKNSDLNYQREYRLALRTEMPNDHFIKIGKLNGSTTIKTDSLNNFALSISYKSYSLAE